MFLSQCFVWVCAVFLVKRGSTAPLSVKKRETRCLLYIFEIQHIKLHGFFTTLKSLTLIWDQFQKTFIVILIDFNFHIPHLLQYYWSIRVVSAIFLRKPYHGKHEVIDLPARNNSISCHNVPDEKVYPNSKLHLHHNNDRYISYQPNHISLNQQHFDIFHFPLIVVVVFWGNLILWAELPIYK